MSKIDEIKTCINENILRYVPKKFQDSMDMVGTCDEFTHITTTHFYFYSKMMSGREISITWLHTEDKLILEVKGNFTWEDFGFFSTLFKKTNTQDIVKDILQKNNLLGEYMEGLFKKKVVVI